MGYEQKAREAREAIGKFNVTIVFCYADGTEESYDVKSWNHVGSFIACDLYDGTMKVFCLNDQTKWFHIKPQNKSAIEVV